MNWLLGFNLELAENILYIVFSLKIQKVRTLLYIFPSSISQPNPRGVSVSHEALDSQSKSYSPESSMTLETIISVGVFGWLAMGMVLMGLGIW